MFEVIQRALPDEMFEVRQEGPNEEEDLREQHPLRHLLPVDGDGNEPSRCE